MNVGKEVIFECGYEEAEGNEPERVTPSKQSEIDLFSFQRKLRAAGEYIHTHMIYQSFVQSILSH